MKRQYCLQPDPHDHRDHFYAPPLSGVTLAQNVDLRAKCSPIVDQGSLGSCTANAIASGLLEYRQIVNGTTLVPLSRLWLYYEERAAEGTIPQDAGANLRDGMKIANKSGCAPESDWPYVIAHFAQKPPAKAGTDAKHFAIGHYSRVPNLMYLMEALAAGNPVVFGATIFSSFESATVAQTGIVPLPKKKEQVLGGHALLAVGYDQGKHIVIVRNSWGTSWGDKGYCYLPMSYFTPTYVSDMWLGS